MVDDPMGMRPEDTQRLADLQSASLYAKRLQGCLLHLSGPVMSSDALWVDEAHNLQSLQVVESLNSRNPKDLLAGQEIADEFCEYTSHKECRHAYTPSLIFLHFL